MNKKHKKEKIEKAEVLEVVDEKSLTQAKENKLEVKEEKEKIKNKKGFNILKPVGYFLVITAMILLFIETAIFLTSLFNPGFFAEGFYEISGIYIFEYLNIFQFYTLWIGGFLLDLAFIILILIFGFYLIDKKENKKDNKNLKKNLKLTFFSGLLVFVLGILISYGDLKQICKENKYKYHFDSEQQYNEHKGGYFKGDFNYHENINGHKKNINKEFESLEEMEDFFEHLNGRIY